MSNRITTLFEKKATGILSIYFTAGYPQLNDTLPLIRHLDQTGVDLIEIGFPFSDPLADGPTIQASSKQAIENGMNLQLLFDQLKTLREVSDIPVILMGYMNPVLQFGEEAFIRACTEIGVDGVIIPDMPLDYYEQKLRQSFTDAGLCNILLITPDTSEDRIRIIDRLSTGFVYMVSSNSITGGNKDMELQTSYFERIQKMHLSNPQLIGFGIHNHKTFSQACQYSSGAIIGSAFIKHIGEFGVGKDAVETFVKGVGVFNG